MPHIATDNAIRPTRRRDPFAGVRWLLLPLLSVAAGCASSGRTPGFVYFPEAPARARVVHLKSFNSLRDLVPTRSSWVDIFRGQPPSPYVATPAGIAFHGTHLLICDTGLNAVHDWDLATGAAKRIGTEGATTFVKPVAVAVDGAGVVYVADTGLAEVVAVDPAGGTALRFKPSTGGDYRPVAVAVHGSTLYVADLASHSVDVYSTADGSRVGSFGGIGSENGKFYFPTGIAVDGGGSVFVADMMNSRVQVFGPDLGFRSSMGEPGDRYGDMGKPKHLAVGPDGTIFVADSEFARVHLFNAGGQLLMLLGGEGDEPGGTPMPAGVATAASLPEPLAALVPGGFDADYFVFVTSSIGSKRISLFAVGLRR